MKLRTPDNVVKQIIDLHVQGLSSRPIAVEVYGVASKKSTVNNIIKLWKNGEINYVADSEEDEPIDTTLEMDCQSEDKKLSNYAKRLRSAQRTNNQLRKVQREMFDNLEDGNLFDLESFADVLATKINKGVLQQKQHVMVGAGEPSNKKTLEIIFSDLQIGKVSEFYNTEVAKKALKYYGQEVLKIVEREQPECIVFASLGDVVEDHLKHGVQSAVSTDTSLAEQMADAINEVWWSVLKPLIDTQIPLTFVGIAGNHGSSEHKGMDMFKAGRFGYDYTIYSAWRTLCEASGADHVEFILPEGCFTVVDIYGQLYLYEHGYFNQVGEKQMEDHKKKRQENLKMYIHGYRQGDKHHSVQYDNSNLLVSGSFFGIERQGAEYSGILGFNSIPLQTVVVHEPVSGVGQSTISQVYQIQIAKGY